MEKGKYSSVHYEDYLSLDKILTAQNPRSGQLGVEAHDEMLFIITHQVYELWFKQMLHDLASVRDLLKDDIVEEKNIGIAVTRLNRIIEILKLLIDQVRVLETMTPLDFLDFRNYLIPASGFQSIQFRMTEIILGLKTKDRIDYNRTNFLAHYSEAQQKQLKELESAPSVIEIVEKWLERIPFLHTDDFNFIEQYRDAVNRMTEREQRAIEETDYLDDKDKAMRLKMLEDSSKFYTSVLDNTVHDQMIKEGKVHMSYKSTLAALLINLYRDEPILRMPYQLLTSLVDIDELFTMWRYRHAQMVMRMLGRKMGTGGSSGYAYLKDTAERHHIYMDLHNVSTLLIPRSDIPVLPNKLKKHLGFYFSRGN